MVYVVHNPGFVTRSESKILVPRNHVFYVLNWYLWLAFEPGKWYHPNTRRTRSQRPGAVPNEFDNIVFYVHHLKPYPHKV